MGENLEEKEHSDPEREKLARSGEGSQELGGGRWGGIQREVRGAAVGGLNCPHPRPDPRPVPVEQPSEGLFGGSRQSARLGGGREPEEPARQGSGPRPTSGPHLLSPPRRRRRCLPGCRGHCESGLGGAAGRAPPPGPAPARPRPGPAPPRPADASGFANPSRPASAHLRGAPAGPRPMHR